LLISYNEKNYVIDVGPDFRQQLLAAKVSTLESVFLTHEHNDHIIGLDDLRPFIFRQKREMKIYGLPRVLNDVKERFKYAFIASAYPGVPKFELEEVYAGDKIKLDDFEIQCIGVNHGTLPILGYRFGSVAYLTDVKSIDHKNIKLLDDIETIVVSAIRQEHTHHAHMILPEALELIEKLNVKKAYIIHMSHHMGLHDEVQKIVPDHVSLAFDGLTLNF